MGLEAFCKFWLKEGYLEREGSPFDFIETLGTGNKFIGLTLDSSHNGSFCSFVFSFFFSF